MIPFAREISIEKKIPSDNTHGESSCPKIPQKHHHINQPPLPTMPHPTMAVQPMLSQPSSYLHTLHPPFSSRYTMQAFDASGININNVQSRNLSSTSNSTLASTAMTQLVMWNTATTGSRLHAKTFAASAQSMPLLPLCPSPFSSTISQSSAVNSIPQISFNNQVGNAAAQPPPPSTLMNDSGVGGFPTSLASITVPSFTPRMMIGRPSGTFFSLPAQQTGQHSSHSGP